MRLMFLRATYWISGSADKRVTEIYKDERLMMGNFAKEIKKFDKLTDLVNIKPRTKSRIRRKTKLAIH